MFDWLRDIKEQVGERVRSPLYGIFATSWIISNWRAFFIALFESKKTLGLSKVDYIYYKLYPSNELITYGKLFVWPLIATLIYVWLLPNVVHWAFVATEKFKDARKQEKLKILKASVVRGEVYLDLKRKYDETLKSYARVIEDSSDSVIRAGELAVANADLTKELEARQSRINDLDSTIDSLKSTVEVQHTFIGNLKHGPSDVFSEYWESQFVGPSNAGVELFTLLNGYQYMVLTELGINSDGVKMLQHYFDIDRFVYDRAKKVVTFRKVGVGTRKGVILEVELHEKNSGLWEGIESNGVKLTLTKKILPSGPHIILKE